MPICKHTVYEPVWALTWTYQSLWRVHWESCRNYPSIRVVSIWIPRVINTGSKIMNQCLELKICIFNHNGQGFSAAALFTFSSIIHTTAEMWMQSKCPRVSGWIKKMCSTHTTWYYSALNIRVETLTQATTWMIPGSWRAPGGRNGNLLHYPCLGNPHGQRSLEGSTGSQRVGHT